MSTKQQSKDIINCARKGKMDGDTGLRCLVAEGVKMQLDLNFNEKPFWRSALWEATWKNNEAAVKLLVEKGAQVDFRDYQGRSPLHEAAYYGHLHLVEYFLEKGHPLDLMDNFGQSPLSRAVEGCRHDVVELLIKRKAMTNFLDSHNVTAQHCAAFQGMPRMSEWLMYHGAWKNRFAIEELQSGERPERPRIALQGCKTAEQRSPDPSAATPSTLAASSPRRPGDAEDAGEAKPP